MLYRKHCALSPHVSFNPSGTEASHQNAIFSQFISQMLGSRVQTALSKKFFKKIALNKVLCWPYRPGEEGIWSQPCRAEEALDYWNQQTPRWRRCWPRLRERCWADQTVGGPLLFEWEEGKPNHLVDNNYKTHLSDNYGRNRVHINLTS